MTEIDREPGAGAFFPIQQAMLDDVVARRTRRVAWKDFRKHFPPPTLGDTRQARRLEARLLVKRSGRSWGR